MVEMLSAIAFRSDSPDPILDRFEEEYGDRLPPMMRDREVECTCKIKYTLLVPNNATETERQNYGSTLAQMLSEGCSNAHPIKLIVRP